MTEPDSARRERPRIDRGAKAIFIAALRAGASRDEAAAQAGFTANGFYYARKTDRIFALAWAWALELSAIDARARVVPAPTAIAPNSRRQLQARPSRRRKFDDARKRMVLDHFAGTADARAACQAAGVSYSAFVAHRRKDPEFAAACDQALAIAYAALEAEAVRQRLEAQRHLRDAICPAGEISKEFDRVMQLLARYDRKDGRIAFREVRPGRERAWSFNDAILKLDAHLRALAARHGIESEPIRLPPAGDGEGTVE